MSQWPEMFRILSLSGMVTLHTWPAPADTVWLASQLSSQADGAEAAAPDAAPQTVERLVRLPIEELQQSTTKL